MIGSFEILQNLDSIIVVESNDKIVYVNKSVDLSSLTESRATKKKITAKDGNEYEITVYPSPNVKHYDSLTGLYSKGTFEHEASSYYQSTIDSKEQFCAVFMDLDNFKKINDTFGHLNADKILKIVANCIRKNIRSTDLCTRFGGDEFIFLLKSANVETTVRIVEQIRNKIISINEDFGDFAKQLAIGASFGIASSDSGNNIETILNNADLALYKAKENKGSIEIFGGEQMNEGKTI